MIREKYHGARMVDYVFTIKRVKVSMSTRRDHSMNFVDTCALLINKIWLKAFKIEVDKYLTSKCIRPQFEAAFTPSFTNPAVVLHFNLL